MVISVVRMMREMRRHWEVAMVRQVVPIVCLSVIGTLGILQNDSDAQPAPAPPPASAPAPSSQPGAVANPAGQVPASPMPAGQHAPQAAAASVSQPSGGGAAAEPVVAVGRGGYVYLPEGRREPFLALGEPKQQTVAASENAPPLQRVTVAELTVIGIVWGGFGYMAMVQAPDGKGYAIQRGARIGNNNGIVSAITDKAVIVEERFTDIYGKKQVREYAKPLHVKESLP